MDKEARVLICLPTYNEEAAIPQMIEQLRQTGYAFMVTDGGSKDATCQIARSAGLTVLERPGKGKGAGIKQAIQYALEQQFTHLVTIDCDLTYPVNRIPDLVAAATDKDMVIAARNMQKVKWLNRQANYLFTFAINLLYNGRYHDTQSGLRIIKLETFKGLVTADNFDIETELSCKSLALNLKVGEIQVDYFERVGVSKVSIADAFLILYRILYWRFKKVKR